MVDLTARASLAFNFNRYVGVVADIEL